LLPQCPMMVTMMTNRDWIISDGNSAIWIEQTTQMFYTVADSFFSKLSSMEILSILNQVNHSNVLVWEFLLHMQI
jgi:hypothetical protein